MRCGKCEKELHECKCVWAIPIVCQRCGEVNPAEIHTCTPKESFEYWNAVEGWVTIEEVRQHFDTAGCGTIYKTGGEGRVPLYTAPQREWVVLTDEEKKVICQEAANEDWTDLDVINATEAKLKEKNA
jgi:phage FluMu protein Com